MKPLISIENLQAARDHAGRGDLQALEMMMGGPMETGRFLRLACAIAAAVSKVHQSGLVHKDIKPTNILVSASNGDVRLTGFEIASRLARERQSPDPPEFIAGTLAYMAPEQTGRMNRSIDSRSDLYALGVTLYEMLTGGLPFTAGEPMEWVHCHIAKHPVPPAKRRKDVPEVLSAIIMKLLAKTADGRYQTAAGLERDLRRCLVAWETEGGIGDFPLGENDTPDRLLIPEKLYGRERDIETLLAAFDRVVTSGTPELVLVSGYSGIGKSSVINELHKVLVPPGGLFASGKFDQYKRDIPYSTLAQAFQSLIRHLLAASEADLARWRDALRAALGPNGKLMTDLVPELKLIIGDQPPVLELPPRQAQSRFQLVFRRFINIFALPEHPLALFLDDLQWLDAATLELLEDLLTRSDVQHLLLVGAYRDNEVDSSHPLIRKLNILRGAGATLQEIKLAPLSPADLTQLVVDTLRCDGRRAGPLAQLVHDQSGGNPFFAFQFIIALVDEGLVAFDHVNARWSWDLECIRAKGYTDNVVDLMVGKLNRLPRDTQNALQQLACLGNIASTRMLSLVLGKSDDETRSDLWDAMRLELVENLEGSYKFVHDRIQEAAYSLIPEDSRAGEHLRIGRLLVAHTPPEKREELIFEIVNQLNRGTHLITSQNEREQLADLNLIAGKRAKASAAYVSALAYLATGAALLPQDAWESRRDLAFALELNRAECEFLTGALATADERLAALSTLAAGLLEQAAVACLRLDLYMAVGQVGRAIAVGLSYLRHAGIEWSPHPMDEEARLEYERIWSQLASRSVEDLIELPLMTDPASLATMDVLAKIGPPTVFTEPNLHALAVCGAVNLSLKCGNSDASCDAYVRLGLIAGERFGDYKAGFHFGEVGCALVERRGFKRFQARTYFLFGSHLVSYARHVRTGCELLHRSFKIALESGDLLFAAAYGTNLVDLLLAAGDPLIEVQRAAEHGLEFARTVRSEMAVDELTAPLWFVRTLRGLTRKFGSFDDEEFEELRFERRLAEDPDRTLSECWYWVRKLQASFFAGEYAAAIQAVTKVQRLKGPPGWLPAAADYQFYSALAHAASYDSAAADARRQHVEALAAHHAQLKVRAEHCPDNFENRAALVGAEIARIEGRELDAMRLYEHAIHSARANGFVQNQALANELAARFYAACGFEQIAHLYLRNARYSYLSWGADGKVKQLDELYPHLKTEKPTPGPAGIIGAPVEHLDLATVIKVSQAVSGEIVLEKLIDTIMRTAIEQAGAERGLLILSRGVQQRINAEATTIAETVVVHQREEAVTEAVLPDSVLHYVLRTGESVILDDAVNQDPFCTDPYIRQHWVRSVLCLPLLNQAKLIGVLYLENNLAPRVFAPTRIAALKLLASQAAISLENTRLYRDLAEREAKIRRLVDANIIGIVIFSLEGQIIETNDAFLHMVGYDHEDLVSGRIRWTDLTPPEWLDRDARQWVPELKRTGILVPFEKEYFRKDGSRVPVLIGAATFDESRNQGVGFVLDLTERKRVEAALRGSEEQWKAVFENNPVMYFMVDAAGIIISVNPFGAAQLGYRVDELIGRPVYHVFHAADREAAQRNAAICFEQLGQAMSWELRKVRKNGEVIWVRETARATLIKNRPVVLIVCEDITEAKCTAETLREVQTELAHANRLAAMGQLTASIAHDVNQPITAARNNASAALRFLDRVPPDLAEVRDALAEVVNDADRAGNIIERIREQIKKAPPLQERFDINEAVIEVIALTRSEAAKNGVSVETRLANGSPPVHGDRVQLQQVMFNLILNAIEAVSGDGDGSRKVSVSTEQSQSDGVLVSVRDSGPGINPDQVERVFEPFYTTKSNGMGLGLSICRSIVEAHGGRLWASSNMPRGAVFQFTLASER